MVSINVASRVVKVRKEGSSRQSYRIVNEGFISNVIIIEAGKCVKFDYVYRDTM